MRRLDARLAALAMLSPAQLRDEWARLYESAAPRLSPDLLKLGIAYRLQDQAGKGLAASALRQLRSGGAPPPPAREPVTLRPGTELVRTWHGRTLRVSVEDKGFRFEGRRYASLTAIAREITGAAWSGPRFFGLTKAREVAHG
ncbi:hypothetical protein CLG96_04300 [Sphingomonas oleivorans]|uniref:DUF2924 domain-containing protein n=1 Tax=Sphingomonas oleivorans TaxID=1735121 RepID=A0A2T5G2F7_9SPHN|nr:DUF2924 domain-containing protein [Sphingomonas oleivorans]PTQ13328.1 hypothetical protein CLG96_04300 [Sphingomonas oleivorans]